MATKHEFYFLDKENTCRPFECSEIGQSQTGLLRGQ